MTTYRASYRTTTAYAPFAWPEDASEDAGSDRTGAGERRARPGRRSTRAGADVVATARGAEMVGTAERLGGSALVEFQERISRAGRAPSRAGTGRGDSRPPRRARGVSRRAPLDGDPASLPARRRSRFPAVGGWLLVLVGLTTVGLTTLAENVSQHPRYRRLMRYRLAGSVFAALTVFLFSGVSVYAVVLPQVGVHAPGQNALHKLLSLVPGPWHPNRPAHVAAPEGMSHTPAPAPSINYPPSALTPAEGIGPGRTVAIAVIGDVPPAPAPSETAAGLPPLPPAARLENVAHQWQTWNNCGPATMTMAASVFGKGQANGQTEAMNFMKTTPNDKNVRPDEMVAYARSIGLQADWRVGGDPGRLKQFLANGIPVIVEVNYVPEPNDWMGHYRLLVGYDDGAGRFIAYDSVLPPGLNVPQPYGTFDEAWRQFNRTYIPVYKPEQADLVSRILGRDRDDRQMFDHALAIAQAETSAQPDNGFAWFNMGTNLVALGRTAEAVAAYDRARTLKLPWRMLWYQFGPFDAYLAEGRTSDVLALADANLAQSTDLEESHYFRGKALQARGQTEAARSAFQAALRANGRYTPASEALKGLT